MQNAIIVIILIIILIPACMSAFKHLKGEGSCCGGPKVKVKKKKIDGVKLGEYVVSIEGMMCSNCKNTVEKRLNELQGVVSKVSLEKKQAVVSYYEEIDKETVKKAVEQVGYKVTNIE